MTLRPNSMAAGVAHAGGICFTGPMQANVTTVPAGPRLTMASLRQGLRAVAAADPDIAAAVTRVGPPAELRSAEPGFRGLLRIMVGQRVSAASARAIWGRIEAAVTPLDPPNLLRALRETPESLGLSRSKRAYAQGLAEAVLTGGLDFARIDTLPDAEGAARITALKGFGDWSAGVYLLFALGRPNAWPANDLAIAVAIQRLKQLNNRPNRREMDKLAESWQPWRGATALFLWHYYHRTGGQQQFSDQSLGETQPADRNDMSAPPD